MANPVLPLPPRVPVPGGLMFITRQEQVSGEVTAQFVIVQDGWEQGDSRCTCCFLGFCHSTAFHEQELEEAREE